MTSRMDRATTPGNMWDRIIALERTLRYLTESTATPLANPEAGEGEIIYEVGDSSDKVALDGSNEASWIPDGGQQDITGSFNLNGAYSYLIADTEALQMWDTENVAVGLQYDAGGITGDYNLLGGVGAGATLATGGYNVILGAGADGSAATAYSIIHGYQAGNGSAIIATSIVFGYLAASDSAELSDSIGIGKYALRGAYSDTDIALGNFAGQNLNSGATTAYGFNIHIGDEAGYGADNAWDTLYIGEDAGYGTDGVDNVGLGSFTLSEGNTISFVTAIGTSAGGYTDGNDGWFGGYKAGNRLTGAQNTITGSQSAAYQYKPGVEPAIAGAIYYGYKAGRYEASSNRVHIGGPAPWLYGETDTPLARFYADLEIYDPTTLGSETLNETSFATHAKWDVTGDFDDTGGNALYTKSAGSGTLTQTSVNLATTAVANAWYKFTYTVTPIGSGDGIITSNILGTITTAFAASAQQLYITDSGAHTIYFKSAAVPGNFVISVTSVFAIDIFSIDNVSLKQITGGDLYVNGTATMQGGVINNITHIDDGDGPYTALSSDEVVFCDTDGGAITVNLPAGVEGTHYKIINCGTSGNDVTVDGNSTELVYGELTQTLRDGDVLDLNFSAVQGWY